MTKRAILAVAGFVALCLSASAQPTQMPAQLQIDGSTAFRRIPSLSLDQEREQFFFSTALGPMRATEQFLPAFSPWESYSVAYLPSSSRRNSLDNLVDWRAPNRVRFGGEIGFLYGKSSGKYGREDFQSYIIGTVGNDTFSITAGYLHQESTFERPRGRRR